MKILYNHILSIILLMMSPLVVGLTGCTQNDGDISPLFGTWVMESLKVDGEEIELADPVCWSFQNHVLCFKILIPVHGTEDYWSSWSREPGHITIYFDNYDDATSPGEWPYGPPPGMGFPKPPSQARLDIREMTGKRMTLEYVSEKEVTYEYSLKKLY